MDNQFWVEEVIRLYREGYSVKAAIWIVKKERSKKYGKALEHKGGNLSKS